MNSCWRIILPIVGLLSLPGCVAAPYAILATVAAADAVGINPMGRPAAAPNLHSDPTLPDPGDAALLQRFAALRAEGPPPTEAQFEAASSLCTLSPAMAQTIGYTSRMRESTAVTPAAATPPSSFSFQVKLISGECPGNQPNGPIVALARLSSSESGVTGTNVSRVEGTLLDGRHEGEWVHYTRQFMTQLGTTVRQDGAMHRAGERVSNAVSRLAHSAGANTTVETPIQAGRYAVTTYTGPTLQARFEILNAQIDGTFRNFFAGRETVQCWRAGQQVRTGAC